MQDKTASKEKLKKREKEEKSWTLENNNAD